MQRTTVRAIPLVKCDTVFLLMPEQPEFFQPDAALLLQLVPPNGIKMPFGKYKDYFLCDLPVSYLEWFQRKGFPKGKLGLLLGTIYEIKMNGLGYFTGAIKGEPGAERTAGRKRPREKQR